MVLVLVTVSTITHARRDESEGRKELKKQTKKGKKEERKYIQSCLLVKLKQLLFVLQLICFRSTKMSSTLFTLHSCLDACSMFAMCWTLYLVSKVYYMTVAPRVGDKRGHSSLFCTCTSCSKYFAVTVAQMK